MTVLSSKQVLLDNKTRDANDITALTLTHKALSDVSCLSEFKKLERLDLSFNNLTSLEGLKSCVTVKWLSVVQNKLHSLKGIEGLTKLSVLNAGKNKLKSMDDVMSLVSLFALILNDNEIVSICKLDQMKELNTLVLSRNPISVIGESLVKVKSITKLSFSNCQLQTIGSSLKNCSELKELRLAHNDIKTLPGELACNAKIQNLDLGNNLISSWSDLKVLSSLANLRNLNLQGNPITENEKLAKKIKKLVPHLQILNARPVEKTLKADRVDHFSLNVANKKKGEKIGHGSENKSSKQNVSSKSNDHRLDNAGDIDMEKELKHVKHRTNEPSKEKASDLKENRITDEKKMKKNSKKLAENKNSVLDDEETPFINPDVQKELKLKKRKAEEPLKVLNQKGDSTVTEKKLHKKSKKMKQNEITALIDDGETPFADFFTVDTAENAEIGSEKKTDHNSTEDVDKIGGLVTIPKKKKKIKNQGAGLPTLLLSPAAEVGLGGPSTWDDE